MPWPTYHPAILPTSLSGGKRERSVLSNRRSCHEPHKRTFHSSGGCVERERRSFLASSASAVYSPRGVGCWGSARPELVDSAVVSWDSRCTEQQRDGRVGG